LKYRALDGTGKLLSMPGSKLRDVLYGDTGAVLTAPVLLTEGESDAWTAMSVRPDLYVFGLPSGAGTPPTPHVERLRGCRVYLAFDGDEAGRAGQERWASVLGLSDVRQVQLPDGHDITSLGSVDWLQTLD
jgi:hypothetical protein